MKFEDVHAKFSPLLQEFGSICLAGGCVRDQMLGREAKDFDVFILSDRIAFDYAKAKPAIAAKLKSFEVAPKLVEWHSSEPYLVASILWEGVEVQIMLSPCTSIEELVATFDWSVCLFGFDGQRTLALTDLSAIVAGADLILQKITFPLSTLRRGFRFSERFKMKLRPEDVHALCSAVLVKAAEGKHVGPDANEPDMPSLQAQMSEERLEPQ